MIRILLDTSFLISFADPNRPHHQAAFRWFTHCVNSGILLELSTLVVAEFEVGQPITDLPLKNFHILPFNFLHARKSAEFLSALRNETIERKTGEQRAVVINDLKILGQAEEEGIPFLLTEDQNTMAKFSERLVKTKLCQITPLLLIDGFRPGQLEDPAQDELNLDS